MTNNSLLSHRNKEPESGVLYIVGTPIGNLNDLSPRAKNILKNVSLIACEDTRQTKKIMTKFDMSNNLISFNKFNFANKIKIIIDELKEGNSVGLVSDAGMPIICDPGLELVKETRLNGFDIVCIPGPCAVTTALVTSGMKSCRFVFEGFLPKKKTEREKILVGISKDERTTILFESPHRLNKLLNELKEYCGGKREIQVSRELTKKFEENIVGNLDKVITILKDKEIKGEFTLVVKGIKSTEIKDFNRSYLKKELQELMDAGLSLSSAAKYLAKKKKLTKNIIYNLN
tara:strand:+ start:252 stop:1115 length:864 start_codon:yes stop_codon:yes gene_type:complete